MNREEAESQGATASGGRADQEPVVVWEAANTLEAEIVKGRLEAEGIPAYVSAEAASQIFGLSTGGLARASVLVPALLAERAIEVLNADVDVEDDGAAPE